MLLRIMPVDSRSDILAAVDLGSNSFHLQIGRVVDNQIYLLDSLREPARLGAGLTRDRRLDRATQLRALEALGRFGERLRGFRKSAVRAVGTNTLRVARNAEQFLEEAEAVLGFPIEVVFGREEARLIYLGVAHSLPPSADRRLVVDVGGGSTEFVIGTGLEPELMESISMGCVSWTMRYFPDGSLDKANFKRAELAAGNELQRIVKSYRRTGWKHSIGSSGTAKTIAALVKGAGWSERGITADGLDRLRAQLIRAGDLARLKLPGLREDRAAVFAGGLAIIGAVFAEFGIEHMEVSDGALRQGVLYDMLGRAQHHDMREATVAEFMRRYHVDGMQAGRVAAMARSVYASLCGGPAEADLQMLVWAASLLEIGISIAHAGYHKHSAYIISQADMPGFSQHEQARLSRLVLAHRGKLAKLESLPARSEDWPLIFALRIAALFHLARADAALPGMDCRTTAEGYQLVLPKDWLSDHPLTGAGLDAEADEWKSIGLRLQVKATGDRADTGA